MTEPVPATDHAADRRHSWRFVMLIGTALAGAAVLVAIITFLGEANRQRDRALQLQTHSFEVMILARTLASSMAEAEATLGRYVISADRQLGQLYGDEWRRAGDQIEQLARVTADNPRQRATVAQLRAAYMSRGQELSLTALSTNYGKNEQALARFYQARQAESLRSINRLLDKVIDDEHVLLADRSSDAMRSVDRSSRATRVLSIFGIFIVFGAIVLGWLTVQALGQRSVARPEAEAERVRAFELERAVAAATAELKQQAIERAAAEEKLRQVQKMDAVGKLTGGIAHDFNNMLAVVLSGLELARRHIDTPSVAGRHIDNATEGADRAIALTRRLLAFSRAEALLPTAIDAGQLIAGMSELLDRTLGDAITVETRHEGGGLTIWADQHQLENAMLNLAVNARDAMDGRGTLSIVTSIVDLERGEIGNCVEGPHVAIAVSDTGCGMTAEVADRVFEPFFTTKPVGKGTGLGLTQIFAFVRQSRGEIGIASTPGQGTTVTVYLPRYSGAIRPKPVADTVEALPASTPRSFTILVVEDDPRVLAATAGAIEELGHRPIECNDPLLALDFLDKTQNVDLVISDVLMPGQTGPEVVAKIKQRHPDIGILFVTGYAGDGAGTDVFGGHEVLRKPFTMAALERGIHYAMEAREAKTANTAESIAAE